MSWTEFYSGSIGLTLLLFSVGRPPCQQNTRLVCRFLLPTNPGCYSVKNISISDAKYANRSLVCWQSSIKHKKKTWESSSRAKSTSQRIWDTKRREPSDANSPKSKPHAKPSNKWERNARSQWENSPSKHKNEVLFIIKKKYLIKNKFQTKKTSVFVLALFLDVWRIGLKQCTTVYPRFSCPKSARLQWSDPECNETRRGRINNFIQISI